MPALPTSPKPQDPSPSHHGSPKILVQDPALLFETQETRESALLGNLDGYVVVGLTPRQAQVVKLVLEGMTRPQICETLHVSASTLARIIKRVIRKARGRAAYISHRAAVELYLSEARRYTYRPPRHCPKDREACYYLGYCPFAFIP